MPELPEVEAARRAIEENCIGKKIKSSIIADDSKVIDGVSPSEFQASLLGKTIVAAHRKGKNMWLQLDSPPFPSFQFGMAGAIYIKGVAVTKYKRSAVNDTDEWPSKYSKLFIELDDGLEFSFTDKRRFAKVRLLKDPASNPPISELGPDALLEPMTIDEFMESVKKKKIAIKPLLLDQSFMAGIGNWIADEVLFQARIHPLQVSSSLSKENCESLLKCIKEVIEKAVEVGADSSQYPSNWIFHSREKKPGKAFADGKKIDFITAGGRTTAYVPELQKLTGTQAKKAPPSEPKKQSSDGDDEEDLDDKEENSGETKLKKTQKKTRAVAKKPPAKRKAKESDSDDTGGEEHEKKSETVTKGKQKKATVDTSKKPKITQKKQAKKKSYFMCIAVSKTTSQPITEVSTDKLSLGIKERSRMMDYVSISLVGKERGCPQVLWRVHNAIVQTGQFGFGYLNFPEPEPILTRDIRLPSSISSGEQTVWADVSTLLEAACEDLRDGELIHGENFSLFAAMSALEIMDPKMDSGIKNCGYHSVEEAIENGAAPVPFSFDRTADVQCTLDVMDHLLACEATWHKGHSLAQTVFSCIYLLRLERTSSHALLHSYCRVIRATCNAVISAVSDARTHEEEDLFTMAYGLPLKGEGDDKCLSMLNAVEETISRQLRACKATSSKKRVTEGRYFSNYQLFHLTFFSFLFCTYYFNYLFHSIQHFYHVLMSMRKSQGRGLELARKHIASCLSELACMLRSLEFLRSSVSGSCQDDIENRTTASGCQPVGFDASLNSRLSAPIPPRAIKILSWNKAIEYFEKLLHDLDVICSFSLDPFLEGILRFVVQFQKLQPDLVARAHLQQILLVQDGKLYGRDPIFDVISRAAKLPDVAKNHNVQKNEFVVQLGQLVINLLKILCTNTAWQRRKLGKILQDWSVTSVQLELAFKREFGELPNISVDENICIKLSKDLLIWTEEQTFWIASRFLMLGFELELYSPSDYCMVYWYMYVIFIKLSEKAQLKMVTSSDAVTRKGKKKRDHSKDVVREPQISPSVLLLQCYIYLTEGLTMMLAALRNERNIFKRPGIFNTEQERFIQHFDFLQRARVPDQITYMMFTESTIHVHFSTLVKYNYFRDAQRIAKELRSSFSNDPDRLAELKQIEQVAEYNWIALNVIGQVGASDPSLKVSFEFNHHPCFAVAVVKRS
ncbi:NatC N(alpha)-terminal acetyltransferase [Macleaya cordata]|uniref:DNA-(apurinic or apyrimidinic site) lyase n=1 Tax=Macleaya cordata TaxID=56857 RepID=A0A200PNR9_MACCD|nr:NatC N(alpha)-terminal acetyltransferase [Macleaya cordata]